MGRAFLLVALTAWLVFVIAFGFSRLSSEMDELGECAEGLRSNGNYSAASDAEDELAVTGLVGLLGLISVGVSVVSIGWLLSGVFSSERSNSQLTADEERTIGQLFFRTSSRKGRRREGEFSTQMAWSREREVLRPLIILAFGVATAAFRWITDAIGNHIAEVGRVAWPCYLGVMFLLVTAFAKVSMELAHDRRFFETVARTESDPAKRWFCRNRTIGPVQFTMGEMLAAVVALQLIMAALFVAKWHRLTCDRLTGQGSTAGVRALPPPSTRLPVA